MVRKHPPVLLARKGNDPVSSVTFSRRTQGKAVLPYVVGRRKCWWYVCRLVVTNLAVIFGPKLVLVFGGTVNLTRRTKVV